MVTAEIKHDSITLHVDCVTLRMSEAEARALVSLLGRARVYRYVPETDRQTGQEILNALDAVLPPQ